VPPELERQLAPGGVMVLPVAGRLLRLRSGAPGEAPEVTGLGRYLFVPLR
jgi:protein-L-isoaspartate(D-aspartate) O-methyltransferase